MFVFYRLQILQFFRKFLIFPELFGDQKDWGSRGREFKSRHSDHMNEARFSNIFIEKRASSCPQSLEKSRFFSYPLLTSEGENSQNVKRIFLRKVVI